MISFLTRKAPTITEVLREFNESNLPHHGDLPDVSTGDHSVLGLDANLPLIVKELAPLQLKNLTAEKERLAKRMAEIERYELTLQQLLKVVE